MSIEECKLVSKTWKSYLDCNRHVKIRLIRKSVDRYDQVEESWNEVFKKSNSDIIEELFCVVKSSIRLLWRLFVLKFQPF